MAIMVIANPLVLELDTYGPCGGIGRRDRLKICCPYGRPRSSRGRGTKPLFNPIDTAIYCVLEPKNCS